MDETLLNPNQSGFFPTGSCVNHLLAIRLAITHEIFELFNCNLSIEVGSIFLDISKAFDKVWHQGLLYKLKSVGISEEIYDLLKNYLTSRFERIVLNWKTSSWKSVLAGVPQGSI